MSNNLVIRPFRLRETKEFNTEYEFEFISSTRKKVHLVLIVHNPLDDTLISTCSCEDYMYRNRDCKHIQKSIEILKQFGEINEEKRNIEEQHTSQTN